MVPPEGTPTLSDGESNPLLKPRAPTGARPADMPGSARAALGDATGETTKLGMAAMAAENERLVRRQFDLWNARNFDALEAATADDVEVVIVPFDTMLRGARTSRDHSVAWATAFPDAEVEVTRVIADAEGAVVEFIGRGTHTGPLVGPAGTIAATGRYTEIPFCYVYDIEDGKIRRVREYYDTATVMRNLGLGS